ncbi:hypothetical protein NQ160_05810, partial [Microbacterium sp. zg.Y909]|nr:hypothetical protein [Microbacterium sp. zg.Y909]
MAQILNRDAQVLFSQVFGGGTVRGSSARKPVDERAVCPRARSRARRRARRVIAMSEDGWRAFLTGEGVDDWVILHGGPTA